MFATTTYQNVTLLEKRPTSILCQVEAKTIEIPLDELWDEGDELPAVGGLFDLHISRSFARKKGIDK